MEKKNGREKWTINYIIKEEDEEQSTNDEIYEKGISCTN